MEVTINAETIIKAAALLTAIGTIVGIIFGAFKFVERDKRQNRELGGIKQEQTLICYGVLACLKGLKEQGCNGPVTEALNKLERHLNIAAHEMEDSK